MTPNRNRPEKLPKPGAALMALFSREAELEDWRKKSAGHYRPALHVEVLIAIAGEARIWQATRADV